MKFYVWMFLKPALILFVGGEIVENDMELAIPKGGDDAVHEAEELDTTAALGMRGNDPAGGDFERCGQGRSACRL